VGDEHRGIVKGNTDVSREVEVVDVLLGEDFLGALGEPRSHHEDGIIRTEDAELLSHSGEKPFRIPRGEGGLGFDEEIDASVLLGWRDGDEGIDDLWGA
jgi:hypothetical protein